MDGKNIREVTSKGVSYIDDDGQEQFIDFETCYQNYLKSFEDHEYIENIRQQSKDDAELQKWLERRKAWREVGVRNILQPPWADGPYIEFYTERD
ncbi:MAG: hypothetical protein DPW16_10550 [Chloroflexi bacterium]|nr:hypothetical protein [Chloroflexota bacterium]